MLDGVVQNAVIREIYGISWLKDSVPGPAVINIFYEGTLEEDPARRLLVDMWVTWGGAPCLESLGDNFDPAFLTDLTLALFQKVERVIVTRSNDASLDIYRYLV